MKDNKAFLFCAALVLIFFASSVQAWANSTYSWRMPLSFNNTEGQASTTDRPEIVNVTGLHDLGGTCASVCFYANYSTESIIGVEFLDGDGATWCRFKIPLNMSTSQNSTYFLSNSSDMNGGVNVYFGNSTPTGCALPAPDWNYDAAITIAPSGMTGEGTAVFYSAAYAANQQSFTAEAFSNRRIFGVKVKLTNATNSLNLNSWFQLRPDVHSGDSASISESATPFNTLNITSCSDYVTSLFNVSSTLTASALYAIRWSSHGVWSGVVSSDSCSANPGGYAGGSYYYHDDAVDLTPRDWNSIILVTSAVDAAQGAEVSNTLPSEYVLFNAPANFSYAQFNFAINFSYYTETPASRGGCNIYIDGIGHWYNLPVYNWTEYTDAWIFSTLGGHSFNVSCVNNVSGDWSTALIAFSIVPYLLVNSSFSPSAFELQPTTFTSNIQTLAGNVTNASALVFYNGTAFPATQTNSSNNYSFTLTYSPNLVEVNASNVSFYWNYTFEGAGVSLNSTAYNQTLLFSTFLNSFYAYPLLALGGEPVALSSNVSNLGLASYYVIHYLNNSASYPIFVGSGIWNNTPALPVVSASVLVNASSVLNVSYGGISFLRSYANVSINVSNVNVSACASGNVLLNFTAVDEDTNVSQLFSMSATFWFLNALRTVNYSYSGNWTNVYSALICVDPRIAGQIDSFQEYSAPGYYQRNYFLDHAVVDTSTVYNITLYLGNSSLMKATQFILKDSNGLFLSDYIISVQRYYPATGKFKTVAMVKTGNLGNGLTYLTPNDVFYLFVVSHAGSTIELFLPSRQVICSVASALCEVDLQLHTVLIGEYYQVAGKLYGKCVWNSATNQTVCLMNDGSGLPHVWQLTVTKLGVVSNTIVCQQVLNATAGVLTCSTPLQGEYAYSLMALGSSNSVDGGSFVNGVIQGLFGNGMVFLALPFLLVVGFAVIQSAAAAVVLLGLGLVFAKLVGLIAVSVGIVIGVFIASLLVAWKLRT